MLDPLQWSQLRRWLGNLSPVTLISAAFVYFVARDADSEQLIATAWTAVYALCRSLIITLFVALRVGIFAGRIVSPRFRPRPLIGPNAPAA